MNLVYGEIVDVFDQEGVKMAKIRVGAAFTNVPLTFVPDAELGDTVLISDGIAISRVQQEETKEG